MKCCFMVPTTLTAFMYFKEYSICSFLNIYTPLLIRIEENIKKKKKKMKKRMEGKRWEEKLYRFLLFVFGRGGGKLKEEVELKEEKTRSLWRTCTFCSKYQSPTCLLIWLLWERALDHASQPVNLTATGLTV